jgi:hypothetical protein
MGGKGMLQQCRKIPRLGCAKRRATVYTCSHTVNRTIRARSRGAVAPCSSCTGEVNRMWAAVCSRTSTAGLLRGEKMTYGGGRARSRAHIKAR